MERFKFSNKLWSLHCCLDAGKQLRVRIVLMSLSMLGWGSQNQLMMGNIRLLMFNTLLKQWLGFLYVNMNYCVKSSTVKYALHFCAGHVLEVLSILLSVCLSTNQSAIHPSIYLSPIYPWAQQTKIIYCTVNILSGILNVAQHGCMMTQDRCMMTQDGCMMAQDWCMMTHDGCLMVQDRWMKPQDGCMM